MGLKIYGSTPGHAGQAERSSDPLNSLVGCDKH